MDNKDLRSWAQEIVTAFVQPIDDFSGTLVRQGLNLNENYRNQMAGLNPDEREKLFNLFTQVANETLPEKRRELYEKMARFYEHFYGWEGTQEPGLRGWIIFL